VAGEQAQAAGTPGAGAADSGGTQRRRQAIRAGTRVDPRAVGGGGDGSFRWPKKLAGEAEGLAPHSALEGGFGPCARVGEQIARRPPSRCRRSRQGSGNAADGMEPLEEGVQVQQIVAAVKRMSNSVR